MLKQKLIDLTTKRKVSNSLEQKIIERYYSKTVSKLLIGIVMLIGIVLLISIVLAIGGSISNNDTSFKDYPLNVPAQPKSTDNIPPKPEEKPMKQELEEVDFPPTPQLFFWEDHGTWEFEEAKKRAIEAFEINWTDRDIKLGEHVFTFEDYKIHALIGKGHTAFKDGLYLHALDGYVQALSMDPTNDKAYEGLLETISKLNEPN